MSLHPPRPLCDAARVIRAAASAAVILAGLAAAAGARAAGPEPVRFSWVRGEGAEGCADQQRIAEQVSARLGKSPFSADAPRSIEAVVSRAEHGYRAVIFVRGDGAGPVGTREIGSEAVGCGSIEAASVLAIALAIDPDAALRPPEPTPRPAPPAPLPAPAAPLPAPPLPAPFVMAPRPIAPPRTPVAPRDRLGFSGLALRVGAGFGLLPQITPGVALAGHVSLGSRVDLTAEALWMPEARTDDARFAFGLTALSLGACFVPVRADSVDLAACAALWGGALHAVVFDLEPASPGDYPWVAASAAPRLRVRLGPHVHLEAGAHLLFPITRPPFTVSGWKDPVFRQSPLAVLPFVGLGANFP